MRFWRLIGIAGLTAVFATLAMFYALAEDGRFVPLPDLPAGEPIPLRVAVLTNDAFPNFSPDEWSEVLSFAADALDDHLGLTVAFSPPEPISIKHIFEQLDSGLSADHKGQIADIGSDTVDWARMTDAIRYTLPKHEAGLMAAHAEVARLLDGDTPSLGSGDAVSKRNRLASILTEILREKIGRLRSFGADGFLAKSARGGKPGFNEWIYWDALPSLDLPYDVYLTNQPILSVEYSAYPLHAVMRSGATFGSTGGSAGSAYGSASIASSFFFIDHSKDTLALRGGAHYSREDGIRLTGWLLAHELGHQLLHLAHPWENTACLMRPSNFTPPAVFAAALDPDLCKVGSSPDMTPGAAKIPVAYDLEP